jgi:hypothetical protein
MLGLRPRDIARFARSTRGDVELTLSHPYTTDRGESQGWYCEVELTRSRLARGPTFYRMTALCARPPMARSGRGEFEVSRSKLVWRWVLRCRAYSRALPVVRRFKEWRVQGRALAEHELPGGRRGARRANCGKMK